MKPIRTLNDKLKYPRTGPALPLEVSTEALVSHEISGPFRRVMMRSRNLTIKYPEKSRKPYAERLERFAKSRNIHQLTKLVPRYASVVRGVEKLLAKPMLHPDPTKDAQVRQALQLNLFDAWSHYEACVNEAKRRGTTAIGNLLANPLAKN